jgi:TRAP-type C4-dicarboxylate transport system permease small subunit
MVKLVKTLDNILEQFSKKALIVCVITMLFLSVLNIFLRWFNQTLFWVEPLVRHLVFLSAFLGGALATGSKSHIGIDILHRWLQGKEDSSAAKFILYLTSFISIFTCSWLVYAGYEFMKVELEYGRDVFWGVHSGFLVGIIPFGFLLIGLRFIFILFLVNEKN